MGTDRHDHRGAGREPGERDAEPQGAAGDDPRLRHDNVHEVGPAKELQGAGVALRAHAVLAELTTELDDRRFLLPEPGQRLSKADDVDDVWFETDRQRLHFMKGPFVRLVVLSSRRDDGQLGEPTSNRRVPANVYTRTVQAERGDAFRASGRRAGGRRVIFILPPFVQGLALDGGQAAPGTGIDVLGKRCVSALSILVQGVGPHRQRDAHKKNDSSKRNRRMSAEAPHGR